MVVSYAPAKLGLPNVGVQRLPKAVRCNDGLGGRARCYRSGTPHLAQKLGLNTLPMYALQAGQRQFLSANSTSAIMPPMAIGAAYFSGMPPNTVPACSFAVPIKIATSIIGAVAIICRRLRRANSLLN